MSKTTAKKNLNDRVHASLYKTFYLTRTEVSFTNFNYINDKPER